MATLKKSTTLYLLPRDDRRRLQDQPIDLFSPAGQDRKFPFHLGVAAAARAIDLVVPDFMRGKSRKSVAGGAQLNIKTPQKREKGAPRWVSAF